MHKIHQHLFDSGRIQFCYMHFILKTVFRKISTPCSKVFCHMCTYDERCAYRHFPVIFSFMTYQRVCNYSNTMGATSETGTAYPSGAPEFTTGFHWVRVTWLLVLCMCFVDRCLSFCTFSFGNCVVCSSSIYDSDYPFGIFKLFS